jgi:hypothetical protein
MPAFAVSRMRTAPSPIALDFWQPLAACYGRVVSGDDETLFNLRGVSLSNREPAFRH